jgi:hypothetical protein
MAFIIYFGKFAPQESEILSIKDLEVSSLSMCPSYMH